MSVEVPPSEWLRHERQGYPADLAITGLGPCTGAFAAETLRQGLFYLATTTLSISLLRMAYLGFRLWRLERS